jgi:hypothetical protein
LGFGGRLRLQEPGQCELLVLFLVLLTMSLRAELASASQSLEEGKLLPAEKTLHASLHRHVSPNAQEGLRCFSAVKHLFRSFEGYTLEGVR